MKRGARIFFGVLRMGLFMRIAMPPSIKDVRHAIEKKREG